MFDKKEPKKKVPLPESEARKIDKALERFIVGSLSPLSLVDNKYFKEFMSTINSRYDVPCAKTLKSRLMREFEAAKEELKKDLEGCEFVAITHDSWTSLANVSYETVTVHYIKIDPVTGEWKLMSKVLDTSTVGGSHTAEAIAEFMQAVKVRWNLPEVFATTDNAAVEVKTFTILGWNRVGCFGHLINLVVRKMLQEKHPRAIVAKGRNQVSYFHRSPMATYYYQEKQRNMVFQVKRNFGTS